MPDRSEILEPPALTARPGSASTLEAAGSGGPSYDLHANAYVTKPVDFEASVKVVRQGS